MNRKILTCACALAVMTTLAGPFVLAGHDARCAATLLKETLTISGVDEAVEVFAKLTYDDRDFVFHEAAFLRQGNALIREEHFEEAVALLEMATHIYPQSWKVYDSLGQAYVRAGDKARAAENYEKSLKLKLGDRVSQTR